ncbi:MAG TPA: aminoacetone oxidase family FAD-binding enzyme [Abditibacteriaceae bacterium]
MNDWDVIVVGAGAAGLMAAIFAARQEVDGQTARVLLLDGQTKIGAKILVAGGGRCNVTNEFVAATRFHSESDEAGSAQKHPHKTFVGRVLRAFSVEATHRFFQEAGVELKLEETGKYFPVTDSARTVLNALLQEVQNSGAVLKTGSRVVKIGLHSAHPTSPGGGGVISSKSFASISVTPPPPGEVGWGFHITTSQDEFSARALIVCTGGLALPKSGSDGAGYDFARRLGHSVIFTTPALSPLIAQPARHADLSGITLNVRLTLRDEAQVLASYDGSFLFTHVGYSGPVALNISRHFARERKRHPQAKIYLNLVPHVEEIPARWWHQFAGDNAKRTLVKALSPFLPERVALMVAREAKIDGQQTVGRISGDEMRRVQNTLFDLPLPITDVAPYHKAEATAGGVSLNEIEPATMMSKLQPGLFFAGEVCDVDGWLGGYNFQWAWSSGAVAGRNAARFALK